MARKLLYPIDPYTNVETDDPIYRKFIETARLQAMVINELKKEVTRLRQVIIFAPLDSLPKAPPESPLDVVQHALRNAIMLVGGQQTLAYTIGVSPISVTRWYTGERRMAWYNAKRIESITHGLVCAASLILSKKVKTV